MYAHVFGWSCIALYILQSMAYSEPVGTVMSKFWLWVLTLTQNIYGLKMTNIMAGNTLAAFMHKTTYGDGAEYKVRRNLFKVLLFKSYGIE